MMEKVCCVGHILGESTAYINIFGNDCIGIKPPYTIGSSEDRVGSLNLILQAFGEMLSVNQFADPNT